MYTILKRSQGKTFNVNLPKLNVNTSRELLWETLYDAYEDIALAWHLASSFGIQKRLPKASDIYGTSLALIKNHAVSPTTNSNLHVAPFSFCMANKITLF